MCAATSVGSLLYYRVREERRLEHPDFGPELLELDFVCDVKIFDPSILILDVQFYGETPGILGVTTSNGGVYIVQVDAALTRGSEASIPPQPPSSVCISEIYRCSLEAWTLSFSSPGSSVYFGSDDSILGTAFLLHEQDLKFIPLPDPDLSELLATDPAPVPCDPSAILDTSVAQPVSNTSRAHNAGVVAIWPLHTDPHGDRAKRIVLTGSYDDHIRVIRPQRSPAHRDLAVLNLGGGVWRISHIESINNPDLNPPRRWLILVACMHAGAKVVEVSCRDLEEATDGNGPNDGGFEIREVASFTGHQSMCYGAVMVPGRGRKRKVISTSFYDKLIAEWEFEGPEWLDLVHHRE
ncbi:Diphthine methyltransferase-like protein [Elsinoe fawcettii]|nr:Diphthine methyltransferase-like protein [Elsinoe fawcettii]